MTERKNNDSDFSKSSKLLEDTNNKSLKEDFLKINEHFVEKGIQNSFKALNSNIYNVLNSSFSNVNNDYEKKLENNREIHEKAVVALNSDVLTLKESLDKKQNKLKENEKDICEKLKKTRRFITISKIFKTFLSNYNDNKLKKTKESFIQRICEFKLKRNIFICWRNISKTMSKTRIKIKYSKIYTEKKNEIETFYMQEINNYLEILQKVEIDIKKEIEERKALAKLYDVNMTQGAQKFIKETQSIIEFDSSRVTTPNERSFRQKENVNLHTKK